MFMEDYLDSHREDDITPEHADFMLDLHRLIGIDGLTIDAYGSRGVTIEIVFEDVVLGSWDFADPDEAWVVGETIKSNLDWMEEQGLDRDDQQLAVAQILDVS